jgi:hypothetical protein
MSAAALASAGCARGKEGAKMHRRIVIALICVAVAVSLSGCGGPGNPIEWDDAAERANLIRAANSWARGIEDYDIEAMAGDNMLAAGFLLTITENGESHTKTREELIAELEADADNQTDFRLNYGYTLRLDIDNGVVGGDLMPGEDYVNAWTITHISQYEADIEAFFEVFEEAIDVPRWRSDSGQMSMHFIRSYGAWKILSMEIAFGGDCYGDAAGGRAARGGGFGFGFGRP